MSSTLVSTDGFLLNEYGSDDDTIVPAPEKSRTGWSKVRVSDNSVIVNLLVACDDIAKSYFNKISLIVIVPGLDSTSLLR